MNSIGEMTSAMGRYRRPRHRRMLALTVLGREQVSPHFICVTVGGDDVRHLEQAGFDQWGRLFFGPPGVALPTSERWMLQSALLPASRRPRIRSYSIRRFRPGASAFDIEVAVHGDGPGSDWARTAEPGDRVAFLDEGCGYVPPPGIAWQLLAGDESALPAVMAILEGSPADRPAEVFLEVPADDDVRDGITGATVHWLPRNDSALRPGTLALRAVRAAALPEGRFYAWMAGESSLATGIRRHLVSDRGVPKSDISFRGYWRQGRASLG